MRIRQIKPSFWSDSALADWDDETRLFYIGMWQMADDGGWFRWMPIEVAAMLYPYMDRRKREAKVERCRKALVAAGRLRFSDDCTHVNVPTLIGHQRFSGDTKRVLTFTREHMEKCVGVVAPQIPPPPPPLTASPKASKPDQRIDAPSSIASIIGDKASLLGGTKP